MFYDGVLIVASFTKGLNCRNVKRDLVVIYLLFIKRLKCHYLFAWDLIAILFDNRAYVYFIIESNCYIFLITGLICCFSCFYSRT